MLKMIGIILIMIGIVNIYHYKMALEKGRYVVGKIVGFSYSYMLRKSFPVFQYEINGIIYTLKYKSGYVSKKNIEEKKLNIFKYLLMTLKGIDNKEQKIGKEYSLLVDEKRPKEFWIADDVTVFGRAYTWIIIGIIFLMIVFTMR